MATAVDTIPAAMAIIDHNCSINSPSTISQKKEIQDFGWLIVFSRFLLCFGKCFIKGSAYCCADGRVQSE
jgi:hypothetical protein